MQKKELLEYDDYKAYLNDRLDADPRGRGIRSALARAIRCQTAYVSSVLRGAAHFTPEQGEAINAFFSHSEMEAEFFLLLLQLNRAGSEALRSRLRRQMQKIHASRFDLQKRLAVGQGLSEQDQVLYYSDWHYAAIHTLVSIPGFQQVGKIAARLQLDEKVVGEALDFLRRAGLVEKTQGRLKIGKARLHLGADSPLVAKHHLNWRLRAMQSLSSRRASDLHYSSVVTLSEKDIARLKERIVGFIQEAKALIKDSREECLQGLNVDFYKV